MGGRIGAYDRVMCAGPGLQACRTLEYVVLVRPACVGPGVGCACLCLPAFTQWCPSPVCVEESARADGVEVHPLLGRGVITVCTSLGAAHPPNPPAADPGAGGGGGSFL